MTALPNMHDARPATRGAGTYLGFDYGTQRIGVAVGQRVTATATALVTLHTRHGRVDWDAITRLVHEWRPEGLIVGIALRDDGDDNPVTPLMRRFARQLAGRYHLPVHEVDERLSSVEAAHIEAARGRARAAAIDARAAQIILQTWLSLGSDDRARG